MYLIQTELYSLFLSMLLLLYCQQSILSKIVSNIFWLNKLYHWFQSVIVLCLVSNVLIYFICVCLRIVVSNTYCVVFLLLFFFILCTLCCQFLWIVFALHLVYPMLPVSLDCFCFIFLHLVYPILPVSLDCFCFIFLHLVYPMLPVSLNCFYFVFLHLVYPMLPVSLDCLFLIAYRYSITFICQCLWNDNF